MTDSALSKIDRAAKHIDELNEVLSEKRPFRYVVETDAHASQRSILAKRNPAVISEVTNVAADIVHNLRTALDHAYWEIVSPFAKTKREEKNVQFPFSETAARLEEAVKNRYANRVSASFFQALMDLKPHGEPGGNELLYLVHKLDAVDKHKFPIPTADYKTMLASDIRAQVPDFPTAFTGTIGCGGNGRDVLWGYGYWIPQDWIGKALPDTPHIFEKEIDVPVEIVLRVLFDYQPAPLVPTLYKLADVTRDTIEIIRKAV